MQVPRRPTREELEQLTQAQHTFFGYPSEEVIDLAEGYASVAVFDDYITVSPGYTGKIMLVVWRAMPSLYEAYIWNEKGELQLVKQEE